MIAHLTGKIINKEPGRCVIDAGGVGYLVLLPLKSYDRIPEPGETCSLYIYTNVRDDAIVLYGFAERDEQKIFEKLISVNKVGPKLALAVLSGIDYQELCEAILKGDADRLSAVPGIGKKTAQRMINDLSDSLGDLAQVSFAGSVKSKIPVKPFTPADETLLALITLGYKRGEAELAVRVALDEDENGDSAVLTKLALKAIGSRL